MSRKFPNIELDEWVVTLAPHCVRCSAGVPNHFHGIVVIADADETAGAHLRVRPEQGRHTGLPLRDTGHPPLGEIIQWFKTMTMNEYIRGVKQNGWQSFPGKLGQRNYYEHIIRDEKKLDRIRQYIVGNPVKWMTDEENPAMHSPPA